MLIFSVYNINKLLYALLRLIQFLFLPALILIINSITFGAYIGFTAYIKIVSIFTGFIVIFEFLDIYSIMLKKANYKDLEATNVRKVY